LHVELPRLAIHRVEIEDKRQMQACHQLTVATRLLRTLAVRAPEGRIGRYPAFGETAPTWASISKADADLRCRTGGLR
jgi:hypothetical protein